MTWGTPLEMEVRRRITVSVAAYAYEIANKPIMSDLTFDWLAQQISPEIGTCHPLIDEFFIDRFSPMTGMWIHDHPELGSIERTFERYYAVTRDHFDDPVIRRKLSRQGP